MDSNEYCKKKGIVRRRAISLNWVVDHMKLTSQRWLDSCFPMQA